MNKTDELRSSLARHVEVTGAPYSAIAERAGVPVSRIYRLVAGEGMRAEYALRLHDFLTNAAIPAPKKTR